MAAEAMEAGRWEEVESLYHAVLAVEPEERWRFLDGACSGDQELRREVESLLVFGDAPVRCSSARLEPGTTLNGRFAIVCRIGGGGMGEVYEAVDLELGDHVALKVIRPEIIDRPDMLPRFRREVQSAKKIAHPNVCRVHDLHRHVPDTGGPEVIFLTMELLEGETLRKRIERGPVSLDEAKTLAAQLTGALQAAHEAGVVHCDFKSENVILCTMPDGNTRAVVTDFGLARSGDAGGLSASITQAGQVIGTPAYMAPEQLLGEAVTPAVDIYALGLVLYEMLTGTPPFTGDSALAVVAQRLSTPPPAPSSRVSGLPPCWDSAILGCLEYYRSKRFNSPLDVWNAISGEGPTTIPAAPQRRPFVGMTWVMTGVAVTALTAVGWRVTHPQLRASMGPAAGIYLAILPLRTPADDEGLRYRAEGIADDLTARLFPFKDLHLSSRSAVDAVRKQPEAKAARNLGATMLVTGSLQNSGEAGALNAVLSLEDTRSGKLVWTDRFAGNTNNLLSMEDQISTRLLEALSVSASGQQMARASAHPTEDPRAYDSYLRGRSLLRGKRDEATLKTAIDLYNSALGRDSRFGLAYASLADAATFMYDLKKDRYWLDKAVHDANEAVRWSPDTPESHTALGSAYRATGRTNEAIVELKRALELAPGSDEAYRRLASAYSDLGDKEEAIRYFRQAIEVNPYYWMNYNQLGRLYLTLGRYSEAMESYQKVTEAAPDIPAGFTNVAATWMYQGQYEKAIEPLARAIQLSPTALAYANLATCYYDLGQHQKALEYGQKAAALDPRNDIAEGNLADAYRGTGQLDKAKTSYERAIQLAYAALQANPRSAAATQRLSIYYAKLNRFDAARQFLQRARAIAPDDVEFLFNAGLVESIIGDDRAALRDLDLAVRKGYPLAQIESEPDLRGLRRKETYRTSLATWRAATHR